MGRKVSRVRTAFRTAIRLAGAVLLFAPCLAPAQSTGIVSGAVLEAGTNDPVRKAIVTLTLQGTPPTWATTRTDSSGHFRFENLPAGKYTLRATKNGLGTAVYGANAARDTGDFLALGAGDIREGLTLRFLRLASVSGHVLNADGDPLAGATVQLQRPTRNLGERVLANYRGAGTDDRGEFHIPNVDVGQYYLMVNPQSGRRTPAGFGAVYAPQYYGGAHESKDSKILNIHTGENLTGIDFTVSPEPVYRIHGRVIGVPDLVAPAIPSNGILGPNFRRGNQVEISLTRLGETAQQNSNGTAAGPPGFQFDFGEVIGGLYRLDARVYSADKTLSASEELDSRTAGEITLTLAPALDISGVLQVEGELDRARGMQILLARPGGRNENISGRPDAAGNFTLKQVPPGDWSINISNMPQGAFLKSATFGDQDVRFARFAIDPGTRNTLRVSISMRTARLEGQVEAGGLDFKRAGIVLAPTGKFHDLARFYYAVLADDEGRFHLENLVPGKYRIYALEKTAPGDFRNPEAADRLGEISEEIELTEGGVLQVHPKLIAAARAREALPPEIR